MSAAPPSLVSRPTRVRYSVLFLFCTLSMITYIDRAFWGSAQEDIRKELGVSLPDVIIALWAFQLAYALFEVPTGYLGDRYGPRKTLIRIVLWWSFFFCMTTTVGYQIGSFAMAGTAGLVILIIFRFLFGVGEAGAYPNIARGLYNWFPLSQRGTAQGAVWMSARFMGGLTPLIWLCLVDPQMLGLHWKAGFWVFGGVGLLWCAIFAMWFRNTPEEHPSTNEAERQLIASDRGEAQLHGGVPWRKIFASRNLWYVCGMYVCINYGWYFFMYFLPGFLKKTFAGQTETLEQRVVMALLAGGPLLVGVFGCLIGGILTDRHVKRTGDRKWGRSLYGVIGFTGAGGCYLLAIAGARSGNMLMFAAGVALSGFFNDLTMGASWAVCQDIGRRYAAIVSGFMNMIGNLLGGVTTIVVTGAILRAQIEPRVAEAKATAEASGASAEAIKAAVEVATQAGEIEGFTINLSLYAAAYFIGVVFWLLIDARKPIVPDEPTPEPGTNGHAA
jgi:MFS transporter, ACS family, glucarate transporter